MSSNRFHSLDPSIKLINLEGLHIPPPPNVYSNLGLHDDGTLEEAPDTPTKDPVSQPGSVQPVPDTPTVGSVPEIGLIQAVGGTVGTKRTASGVSGLVDPAFKRTMGWESGGGSGSRSHPEDSEDEDSKDEDEEVELGSGRPKPDQLRPRTGQESASHSSPPPPANGEEEESGEVGSPTSPRTARCSNSINSGGSKGGGDEVIQRGSDDAGSFCGGAEGEEGFRCAREDQACLKATKRTPEHLGSAEDPANRPASRLVQLNNFGHKLSVFKVDVTLERSKQVQKIKNTEASIKHLKEFINRREKSMSDIRALGHCPDQSRELLSAAETTLADHKESYKQILSLLRDSPMLWTIHGLWPDNVNNIPRIQPAKSNVTIPDNLDTDWVSCLSNMDNESFRNHEYLKHGRNCGGPEIYTGDYAKNLYQSHALGLLPAARLIADRAAEYGAPFFDRNTGTKGWKIFNSDSELVAEIMTSGDCLVYIDWCEGTQIWCCKRYGDDDCSVAGAASAAAIDASAAAEAAAEIAAFVGAKVTDAESAASATTAKLAGNLVRNMAAFCSVAGAASAAAIDASAAAEAAAETAAFVGAKVTDAESAASATTAKRAGNLARNMVALARGSVDAVKKAVTIVESARIAAAKGATAPVAAAERGATPVTTVDAAVNAAAAAVKAVTEAVGDVDAAKTFVRDIKKKADDAAVAATTAEKLAEDAATALDTAAAATAAAADTTAAAAVEHRAAAHHMRDAASLMRLVAAATRAKTAAVDAANAVGAHETKAQCARKDVNQAAKTAMKSAKVATSADASDAKKTGAIKGAIKSAKEAAAAAAAAATAATAAQRAAFQIDWLPARVVKS